MTRTNLTKLFFIGLLFCGTVSAQIFNQNATVLYPDNAGNSSASTPFTALQTIDADGEKNYKLFKMPDSKTIERVIFHTANMVTGGSVTYSMETISMQNGFPTGTYWCTNSSAAFSPTTTDDNVQVAGLPLTQPCAVNMGDIIAIGITRDIGVGSTFNGSLADIFGSMDEPAQVSSNTAANFVKAIGAGPSFLLRYTDGTFGTFSNYAWCNGFSTLIIGSNTATNEAGAVYLNMPFAGRIKGEEAYLLLSSSVTLNIWRNNNKEYSVVLTSATDSDNTGGTHRVLFDRTITFAKGDTLRATIAPRTTTTMTVYFTTVFATSAFTGPTLADIAPWGDRVFMSTASSPTSGASFFNNRNARPFINLILDQVDYGVPSGGGGVSQ